jgi:DNA polymerase-1
MGMFSVLPPAEKILTADDALNLLNKLDGLDTLAVDTETTGLSRTRDRAVVLALSDGISRWAVWPSAIPYFKRVLEDPKVDLIFHNANFDTWMLNNVGINLYRNTPRKQYRVHDTMVMHALINDTAAHDLKSVTKWYLDIDMVPFKEVFNLGKRKVDLQEMLLSPENEDITANYASLDAFATFKLWKLFKKYLADVSIGKRKSLLTYYQDYEVPFTKILWTMEHAGILIDKDSLLSMAPRIEDELLQIQKWFGRTTGELYVNLGSNPEMGRIFYGKLGRPVKERTAGGDPALTKTILKRWARDGCEHASKLLKWRELKKQLSTYILSIYEKVHVDGRIHAAFNQTGARTGRLSSSDPNLQNQPPFIRNAYIAPEDYLLFASDYGQLEMRILAHKSKDPTICNAIIDGLDIHCATAATMFGLKYEDVKAAKDKDDAGLELADAEKDLLGKRKASKTIGFGLMYGQGASKLGATLNIEYEAAVKLMNRFFDKFPAVVKYFKKAISTAKKTGYCETILGRRRTIPGVNSYYKKDVSAAERQIKNTPIQGSAADICKLAMIKVHEDDYIHSAGARLLIQVHDELVFEVPKELAGDKEFNQRIKALMSHPLEFDLRVPLETSAKYGDNWLQCK